MREKIGFLQAGFKPGFQLPSPFFYPSIIARVQTIADKTNECTGIREAQVAYFAKISSAAISKSGITGAAEQIERPSQIVTWVGEV
ncbi:MAG: hypothetical protein Q7T20_06065 [Saprospiraceae bacterium]|nr:hypothetical protein [Saprospiraceae bacterium]